MSVALLPSTNSTIGARHTVSVAGLTLLVENIRGSKLVAKTKQYHG